MSNDTQRDLFRPVKELRCRGRHLKFEEGKVGLLLFGKETLRSSLFVVERFE